MSKVIQNILAIVVVCVLAYFIFMSIGVKEGMTSDSTSGSSSNGVAGNAAGYAASIKAQVIKMQDILLINKYRTDYENVILNLDDLINNLMLQAALNIDPTQPKDGLDKLNQIASLNNSKVALNNVMKFIDGK